MLKPVTYIATGGRDSDLLQTGNFGVRTPLMAKFSVPVQ